MCENMDHSDIVDQWRDSISLSNGELGDATISCFIVDGMEMIRDGDSTTQITFAIVTTFEYDSAVTFPLQISLSEQPLPTDGSISWLAPAHPVALRFSGDGLVSQTIPLWWNNVGDSASVTIEEVEVKEPTVIESAIDWAMHPIAFIFYLGVLIGIGTLWLRHQNKIDFDVEDEEIAEEEDSDEEDEEDEPDTSPGQNADNDGTVVKERPKRTPPPSKRKMYSTSSDNEPLAKKRRVSETKLNKDGPIMKTKRKRLDSIDQNSEGSTSRPIVAGKKKVVKPEDNVIKTRKVKTAKKEETKPEPEVKKKRKPVKRKKKGSGKKIDEEKLQDNLVSDFLKEE